MTKVIAYFLTGLLVVLAISLAMVIPTWLLCVVIFVTNYKEIRDFCIKVWGWINEELINKEVK